MKNLTKLVATVAATSLLLMPSAAAMAEDIAEPMPLGAPAPEWLTLTQLEDSAEYQAISDAGAKTLSNIKASRNFNIKIGEVLTSASKGTSLGSLSVQLLGNKTAGLVRYTTSGLLNGQSSTYGTCGYTKGRYYVDLNKAATVDEVTKVTAALAKMKSSKAVRAYDAKQYNFSPWAKQCFSDPKPSAFLAGMAHSALTPSGVVSQLFTLGARFKPITSTPASTTTKYTLVGEIINPEDNEQQMQYSINYTVANKDKSLVKELVSIAQTGMGFDAVLTYDFASTAKVNVPVATDHAVSALALERTSAALSANTQALRQASLVASAANSASNKSHRKITAKSLKATAAAQHVKGTASGSSFRVTLSWAYKLYASSSKPLHVAGQACVNVVKGKAVAKACK